jgi:hypothetical protein
MNWVISIVRAKLAINTDITSKEVFLYNKLTRNAVGNRSRKFPIRFSFGPRQNTSIEIEF